MRQIVLPNTSLSLSRFIFGTASLFNVGDAKKRHELLAAAVDHGFTHIDTAPYYGFGFAERDMAPVLKANPHVTVTTKVGIYSAGGESQPAFAVFLRKAAGRAVKAFSRPTIDFSVARARTALEASLRRLGRERIDLYTMHEPRFAMVNTEEWLRFFEDMVAQGKIGTYGVALTADKLVPFLESNSPLCQVVQVIDSLEGREADILTSHGRPLQITYGYIKAALQAGTTRPIPEILQDALRRNSEGAIIVSTNKVTRLPQYARLADGV